MATLQLNGKTLATQVSSAEPVLASNVNVTSSLASATFPAGHVIQTKIRTDTESLVNASSAATLALSCTSGNILFVTICGGIHYHAYSSGYANRAISVTANGSTVSYNLARHSSNNAISAGDGAIILAVPVTYTGTHTVKRNVNGNDDARWSVDGSATTVYWCMQEIKPTS